MEETKSQILHGVLSLAEANKHWMSITVDAGCSGVRMKERVHHILHALRPNVLTSLAQTHGVLPPPLPPTPAPTNHSCTQRRGVGCSLELFIFQPFATCSQSSSLSLTPCRAHCCQPYSHTLVSFCLPSLCPLHTTDHIHKTALRFNI